MAAKWVRRFRQAGADGVRDRSSHPHRLRPPTTAELVARIEVLRRQRWTGARIAQQTVVSCATVSRILRRLKLSRVRDLEPRPMYPRYEHAGPGDLLHLDRKKLVRIAQPSHRVTGDGERSVTNRPGRNRRRAFQTPRHRRGRCRSGGARCIRTGRSLRRRRPWASLARSAHAGSRRVRRPPA